MDKKQIEKAIVKCTKKSGARLYRLSTPEGHLIADNIDAGFLLTVRRSLFGTSPHRSIIELDLDRPEPFIKTSDWYESKGIQKN